MYLSTWVCVFLVALSCVLPVLTHPQNDPINENWESSGSSPTERRKRAVGNVAVKLIQLGTAAVNRLLTETWKIRSNDKRIRKYVKVGDYEAALRDFRSVNPTYTSTYMRKDGTKIVEGRAGDKLIRVVSRGEQGMPTINIIDYNKADIVHKKQRKGPPKAIVTGQPVDRIIYKKTLTLKKDN